jgi:hypothetical protein
MPAHTQKDTRWLTGYKLAFMIIAALYAVLYWARYYQAEQFCASRNLYMVRSQGEFVCMLGIPVNELESKPTPRRSSQWKRV